MQDKKINRLKEIDWNFNKKLDKSSIHNIHPYPAKFIPEIPLSIIKELGVQPKTGVLDPFCGSGTTLIASQSLDIPSVGIDLNPIACLISQVKCSSNDEYENLLIIAEKIANNAKKNKIDLDEIKNIPNLNHWFKKDIQESTLKLKKEISSVSSSLFSNALKLCLSSILVKISNQESDTRYAAINKNIKGEDVYSLFLKSVKKLVSAKKHTITKKASVQIINQDILTVEDKDINQKISLVITSPPYPNAYEYWLYHKYRMFWLDFDPLKVKDKEIGARAHFFKKNHHTKQDFFDQMTKTFGLISKVLIKNGYAVFIVGRSKIHGELVDNAEIIRKAAETNGLTFEGKIKRLIKSNSKSFNLSHANIKNEELVVLRNN